MLKLLTILALFLSFTITGQEYLEDYAEDVCECFNGEVVSSFESYKNCFQKSAVTYFEEVIKEVDTTNSELSAYQQGMVIGEKFTYDIQRPLIQNCDAYYQLMYKIREDAYTNHHLKFSENYLDSLNTEISSNNSLDLLWERANYFFYTQDFELAAKDYQECIDIRPNYTQAIFFLAWLREKQGEYDESFSLYDTAIEISGNKQLAVFKEIAIRRSKEQ